APTSSQKRNLEQILKAGWYLLELINEVLDLALIESGKATVSREPVPLFEVPQFISADRTRIKQVLINLLFNAIKYNRPGGAVAVECPPAAPASIRISVRD